MKMYHLVIKLIVPIILVAIAVAHPTVVYAQEGTGSSNPEANLPFLFAVYTITWAGFFAYLFFISRRHRELRNEIESLKLERSNEPENQSDSE